MNVDLKERKKKYGALFEHAGEFNFSFRLSRHSCILQNSVIFSCILYIYIHLK